MESRIIAFCWVILLTACGSDVEEGLTYLKQQPPSTHPEVFAPNVISQAAEYEFGSVFNENATEFFYGVDVNGKSEIRYTKLDGSIWYDPQTILIHDRYGFNDPFLSPDESRLYFISRRASDGIGELTDYDIWYVERRNDGWSDPLNAGPNINSDADEYYISFTDEGTMYYSSNKKAPENQQNDFDIYYSTYKGGEFQASVSLGDSINTSYYEADVFIDPEESFIIFCAIRPDGLGEGDLYISFKKPDGTWTTSKNMDKPINSENHELCPFVSKDGKYLFYTSNQDIYWVSTEILEQYR